MRKLHMQQCQGCHRQFQTYDVGKFFCSDSCQVKKGLRDIKKREPHGELLQGQEHCKHCGKPFYQVHKRHKYCSAACSNASKARTPFKAVCKECKNEFQTVSYQKVYCSEACVKISYLRRKSLETDKRRKAALENPKKRHVGMSYEQLNRWAERKRLEDT